MNKKFKAKVELEFGRYLNLSVTHNGYQWSSIRIDEPDYEIPLIIKELSQHLNKPVEQTANTEPFCLFCKQNHSLSGPCPPE